MENGMSLSRGKRNLERPKSVSKENKKGRDNYMPAPPLSPGEYLRDYILAKSEITQERLAKAMDVSRFSINQIVNGKRAVTADMALRLARVTSTTADLWLNLQRDVDLYIAQLKLKDKLQKLIVLRLPIPENALFLDKD
jgi:antitoxin HigA-1